MIAVTNDTFDIAFDVRDQENYYPGLHPTSGKPAAAAISTIAIDISDSRPNVP